MVHGIPSHQHHSHRQRQGPRGKKTKAQKRRKAAGIEKALAITERKHNKVSKRDKRQLSKNATKALWVVSSIKK